MRGCGSSASCCDAVGDVPSYDPGCGIESHDGACGCDPCAGAEPACGLEAADCGCAEPACGCEASAGPYGPAAPGCGVDVVCDSPCGGKRGGILSRLFSHHRRGSCDAGCEPACGSEVACDPCGAGGPACGCEDVAGCDGLCGGNKRPGLLSRLFGHLHRPSSHCDGGCVGCDGYGPAIAPSDDDAEPAAAPMPPAPVADPSANVSRKRRVIQASAVYVR